LKRLKIKPPEHNIGVKFAQYIKSTKNEGQACRETTEIVHDIEEEHFFGPENLFMVYCL
jgi:hypothetical protein